MANIIAGLGAQLGLDTTEFKKGIGEAKKELKDFAEYLPEALSVAAFVEMTNKAMEFSNQIVETAKANDIATSSVLELSKALQENGGDMEDTGRIYSGFTQKIESAVQGNAKAQESFARLGVTLNDLRHMSEQDLFSKTVSGLANMKDSAERNGLAFMTLGKAIRGVDIKGLADTLEESKGTMDRYAKSIEMAHTLSEQLKASSHNLLLEFTNAFIPTMEALYDHFNKTGNAMQRLFTYLKMGAEAFGIFASAAITALEHIWTTVKVLGKDLYAVFNPQEYLHGTLFETLAKNFDDFKKEFAADTEDYLKSVKEIQDANDEALKPKESPEIARKTTDALQKQLDKANQIAEAYKRQAQASLLATESQLAANEATKNQKQMQDELMKVVLARNKALDEVDKQIAAVDKTVAGHERIIAVLKKQKEQIDDTYSTIIVDTQKAVEANQKLQDSFAYGWDKAFEQYKESAMNAADVGRQTFNSVMSNMESALTKFVKTGKLSFKDLAQSIIQDLLAIQLKAQASSIFSGVGGGISSLFSAASVNGALGRDVGGYSSSGAAFADGGDPPVGQASLVGERGPELFIPKSAGTIIPNNLLSGNNQQSNITYNGPYIATMQAIDTQSATQFLAKNKTAVWSANQSAQRSLPQSR